MQCNLKEMVDIVEIVQAVVMVDIVDIVDIDIADTVEIVDIFDTFNIVDINEAIWIQSLGVPISLGDSAYDGGRDRYAPRAVVVAQSAQLAP